METLEVQDYIEIYSLASCYEGVKIINEPKIRTAKEHNKEVRERRLNPKISLPDSALGSAGITGNV